MTPAASPREAGPIRAVVGPTASGKSAAALEVARRWIRGGQPVEIVAVDAFTVYRGMDLGTAKPSPAERAEVPHHLVDVLDPHEELTVAQFQRRARTAIRDIQRRGALPLLVGGSGLYWRAVVDDLRFPPTDPQVRARLEGRWQDDPAGAHRHLGALDPVAADRIEVANVRRSIRALEVIELTGQPFSSFDDAWEKYVSVLGSLDVGYLEPEPAVLRDRIRRRATTMVADGLLEEAAALRARTLPLSRTAAQAIGYAEAFAVLDGHLGSDDLVDAITVRTWRYAKRQQGWFRRDPRCVPQASHQLVERLGPRSDRHL